MMGLNRKLHRLTALVVIAVIAITVVTTLFSSSTPTQAATNPLQIGWVTGSGLSSPSQMVRIDTQKAAGETLMYGYYSVDPTDYFNKLQLLNIKVWMELDPQAVASGNTAQVVSIVNAWKNIPAIAGWMLFDEPEFNAVSPSTLIGLYNAIKAADPNHQVALTFGDGWCSYLFNPTGNNWYNAADVIMFDKYPISDQPEFEPVIDNSNSMDEYSYTVNDCLTWARSKNKQYITIAQGFNWGGTGPTGARTRNPTYGEERFFTFVPLVEKVKSLLYYVDYVADASLTADVNRTMSEASTIGTMLANGTFKDPSVGVNNTNILYSYGSDGTNTYLVAINNSKNTLNVQFTLPAAVTASSATLMFDAYNTSTGAYQARTIGLTAGTGGTKVFSDNFTKYQVHIYQIGGTGTIPTSTVGPSATNTSTFTPSPTKTSTPLPSATRTFTPSVVPSNTFTFTPSATKTSTSVPPTKTLTPGPSATNTLTFTPTSTNTQTPVPSATKTATPGPSPTNTFTFTPSATKTSTPLPSATKTSTSVPPTNTFTPGPSATNTTTFTPSPTKTATSVPSVTNTPTPKASATNTPTLLPSPTVVRRAPGTPVLLMPYGDVTTSTPTFNWQAAPRAQWYFLWITGANGKVFSHWFDGSLVCKDTACSIPSPINFTNGTYTWWVLGWANGLYGPWSNGMRFTVSGQLTPTAAKLSMPVGPIAQSIPAFKWNSANNAQWYYLWVSGPSGKVIGQWYDGNAICASSICTVTPNLNLPRGIYTWWVLTWGDGNYGPWSAAIKFTVTVDNSAEGTGTPAALPTPINLIGGASK